MIRCCCGEKRLAEPDEDMPLGRCSCAADYCVKGVICERNRHCEAVVRLDVVVLPPVTGRD
jgi:hypothetical protein